MVARKSETQDDGGGDTGAAWGVLGMGLWGEPGASQDAAGFRAPAALCLLAAAPRVAGMGQPGVQAQGTRTWGTFYLRRRQWRGGEAARPRQPSTGVLVGCGVRRGFPAAVDRRRPEVDHARTQWPGLTGSVETRSCCASDTRLPRPPALGLQVLWAHLTWSALALTLSPVPGDGSSRPLPSARHPCISAPFRTPQRAEAAHREPPGPTVSEASLFLIFSVFNDVHLEGLIQLAQRRALRVPYFPTKDSYPSSWHSSTPWCVSATFFNPFIRGWMQRLLPRLSVLSCAVINLAVHGSL